VLFVGVTTAVNPNVGAATATGPTPAVIVFEPELQDPVRGFLRASGYGRIVRPEKGVLV
jgi:hypothetical protein